MITKISEWYHRDLERELKTLSDPNYNFKLYHNFWWYDNEKRALYYYFVENNIEKAKQCFYVCAMLDNLSITKFNNMLFGYGANHVSYAALSDNIDFIQIYSQLNYEIHGMSRGKKYTTSFSQLVAQGDHSIYCDCMLKAMSKDLEGLERNLRIMENITLKKKTRQTMKIDYDFFESILNSDKDKATEIINKLTAPRLHNNRNKYSSVQDFISHPALGFAKIAWINGLEVEPSSDLIPKDLLPIKPNKEYYNEHEKYLKI